MKRLTKNQMIKTAKRLLKPQFHGDMKIENRKGVADDGFEFSFPAVVYNGGKNFIGEEVLRVNCIDY